MSQPPVFPFHATIKWPAQSGPDVMINVYALTAIELAERLDEARTVVREAMPGYLETAPAPAPARQVETREPRPIRNIPSPVAEIECQHGNDGWIDSNWGGWWIPECRCKLSKNGELRAGNGDNRDRFRNPRANAR